MGDVIVVIGGETAEEFVQNVENVLGSGAEPIISSLFAQALGTDHGQQAAVGVIQQQLGGQVIPPYQQGVAAPQGPPQALQGPTGQVYQQPYQPQAAPAAQSGRIMLPGITFKDTAGREQAKSMGAKFTGKEGHPKNTWFIDASSGRPLESLPAHWGAYVCA